MDRAGGQKKHIRRTVEAVETAWDRPRITIERDFLVLRWPRKQAVQAMDAAGMTLERVIAEHLIPNLDATKTVYFKHHGRIMQRCRAPDFRAQFRALKLMTELYCEGLARNYDAGPSKPTPQLIYLDHADAKE